MNLKTVIADDHPLFRVALFEALKPSIGESVVHCEDFEQTMVALEKNTETDLLFLDLKMPGSNGLDGLIQIIKRYPNLSVVVVSAEEHFKVVNKVIQFGACGFIPKSAKLEKMAEALTCILDGDIWVPDHLKVDKQSENTSIFGGELQQMDYIERLSQLTPTQLKVLKMMADGLLNKQIAFELSISESTVKQHSSQVLKKLSLNNRTQAGVIYKQVMDIESSPFNI